MSIGEKIQRLREDRRWTQQELSRRAKVGQPIISRLENNAQAGVNAGVLKRLARTLGCSADYLIGLYEDDEETPSEKAEMVGSEA
jgi:transcriptional regulator with XRE-family HTH domain